MFAKLFLVDKHTIIGIFTAVKNNHTNIKILNIKYGLLFIEIREKQVITKRIQEIAVDFKGMSTFCVTIHWYWQWVRQILHISLRE